MCAVRDTSLHLTTTTPTSCSDAFERRLLQGVVHRLRLHPRVQRMESSWITNDRAPVPPDRRPQSDSPPTADVRRALRRRGGTPVSSGGAAAGERRAAAPIGGGGLGGAAHRDERDRCLGGPAARPGGRVREPRGRTRRAGRPPARRAPAVPRGRVVRARANALSSSGPAAHRGSRRLAPAAARHATLPAPSSPSIAAGQRASGRPRCDSVAVVLPNWSRGGRSAPGGRFTRPQRAGRAARARDRS